MPEQLRVLRVHDKADAKVLTSVAEPVLVVNDTVRELASNMIETMHANDGVGLAAPQVGVRWRMIVIDPGNADRVEDNDWSIGRVFINPEIYEVSDSRIAGHEKCLSVFGAGSIVHRPAWIRLRWMDLDGQSDFGMFRGINARVICHEVDHLDGKLIDSTMNIGWDGPEDMSSVESEIRKIGTDYGDGAKSRGKSDPNRREKGVVKINKKALRKSMMRDARAAQIFAMREAGVSRKDICKQLNIVDGHLNTIITLRKLDDNGRSQATNNMLSRYDPNEVKAFLKEIGR